MAANEDGDLTFEDKMVKKNGLVIASQKTDKSVLATALNMTIIMLMMVFL